MSEIEKDSKFRTLVKCLALIGVFCAMCITEECKADRRVKVSAAEAEAILKGRFSVREKVDEEMLTEPLAIYIECPNSWYEHFVSNAKSYGAPKALQCMSDFQKPRCGRIIQDNALPDGYFRLFQYSTGRIQEVGETVGDQIVWDIYKNVISARDYKPDLNPEEYDEKTRAKTFDYKLASTAFGDDDQKMREVFNADFYDQGFNELLARFPQTIISAFGAVDFHFTYPLHLTTNYPKNDSIGVADKQGDVHTDPLYSIGDMQFGPGTPQHWSEFTAIMFLNSDAVGGELEFYDETTQKTTLITPKENRLILFTSGPENQVNFRPVKKGYMSYLMCHFTCDERRDIVKKDAEVDDTYLPFGQFSQPRNTVDEIEKDFANIAY